ncbi:MAG: hypothetical protein ACE5GG_03540, partial [Candidatus Omnitrophota bacterium]
IHRLKTGILFHIPFLGPETIEERIDIAAMESIKLALAKFGLGCQIIDDIKDISKDYREKRHNYLLSIIYQKGNEADKKRWERLALKTNSQKKAFLYFPDIVYPAAELAYGFMHRGLVTLGRMGLGTTGASAKIMATSMFDILGVGEIKKHLYAQRRYLR